MILLFCCPMSIASRIFPSCVRLYRIPIVFWSVQNTQIYDDSFDLAVLSIIYPFASNCTWLPLLFCVSYFLTLLYRFVFENFFRFFAMFLFSCLNINEVVSFVQKFAASFTVLFVCLCSKTIMFDNFLNLCLVLSFVYLLMLGFGWFYVKVV